MQSLTPKTSLLEMIDIGLGFKIGIDNVTYEAEIHHQRSIAAGRIGQEAAHILRSEVAQMYITEGWSNINVPYDNDPIEKIGFADFRAWLNYVVEKAGLSDSTGSTLATFMENVIDPVAKQLILKPGTSNPYTIDEVLGLREGHTQKTASAARRLLKDGEKTDEEKFGLLGQVLEVASDPSVNIDDMTAMLRDYSLSTRRNDPIEVSKAKTGEKTVYMIVIDEDLEPLVNGALEGRSNMRSRSVDDLVSDLIAIQVTKANVANAATPIEDSWELDTTEPTENELEGYLDSIR